MSLTTMGEYVTEEYLGDLFLPATALYALAARGLVARWPGPDATWRWTENGREWLCDEAGAAMAVVIP